MEPVSTCLRAPGVRAFAAGAPQVAVVRGTVRAFDSATHRASVQPLGSGSTYLHDVPVSKEVVALAAGERVLVICMGEHNAGDAVVLCRFGVSDG